jgi:hypothetical protein
MDVTAAKGLLETTKLLRRSRAAAEDNKGDRVLYEDFLNFSAGSAEPARDRLGTTSLPTTLNRGLLGRSGGWGRFLKQRPTKTEEGPFSGLSPWLGARLSGTWKTGNAVDRSQKTASAPPEKYEGSGKSHWLRSPQSGPAALAPQMTHQRLCRILSFESVQGKSKLAENREKSRSIGTAVSPKMSGKHGASAPDGQRNGRVE